MIFLCLPKLLSNKFKKICLNVFFFSNIWCRIVLQQGDSNLHILSTLRLAFLSVQFKLKYSLCVLSENKIRNKIKPAFVPERKKTLFISFLSRAIWFDIMSICLSIGKINVQQLGVEMVHDILGFPRWVTLNLLTYIDEYSQLYTDTEFLS